MADFHLNSDLTGLNSAIISAGCIFGGPMVGPIVDRWGRKAGLAVASVCIIFGVILQASAASGRWMMSIDHPGTRAYLEPCQPFNSSLLASSSASLL